MFENLRKLYVHYGGIRAVLKSSYFWVALIMTAISYRSIVDHDWAGITLGAMPSLTGFTIAAFAIIFVILDPHLLKKLMTPGANGTSPITSVAASIGHAVFIQVASMILALAFKVADLSEVIAVIAKELHGVGWSSTVFLAATQWIKNMLSAVGLVLTYYGLLLVLAAVLSIFRMQVIVAGIEKGRKPSPKLGEPPS